MLTAVSTVLGMIPIAPTVFWGPMAVAIMGGLLVATVLTLVFLPVAYSTWFGLFERKAEGAPQAGKPSLPDRSAAWLPGASAAPSRRAIRSSAIPATGHCRTNASTLSIACRERAGRPAEASDEAADDIARRTGSAERASTRRERRRSWRPPAWATARREAPTHRARRTGQAGRRPSRSQGRAVAAAASAHQAMSAFAPRRAACRAGSARQTRRKCSISMVEPAEDDDTHHAASPSPRTGLIAYLARYPPVSGRPARPSAMKAIATNEEAALVGAAVPQKREGDEEPALHQDVMRCIERHTFATPSPPPAARGRRGPRRGPSG